MEKSREGRKEVLQGFQLYVHVGTLQDRVSFSRGSTFSHLAPSRVSDMCPTSMDMACRMASRKFITRNRGVRNTNPGATACVCAVTLSPQGYSASSADNLG